MPRGQLRQIIINNQNYYWNVSYLDEHRVVLKVWAKDRKARDKPLQVRIPFSDPWLNFGEIINTPPQQRDQVFQLTPITPKQVRSIILAALAYGWQPLNPIAPLLFDWQDQQLIPV